MADPIGGGGIGKAAQKMIQEIQKQQQMQDMQQIQGGGGAQNAQFANMVNQSQGVGQTNQVQGINDAQQVNQTQKTQEMAKATDVLRAAQNGDMGNLSVKKVDPTQKKAGLSMILDHVVEGQNKLDSIIKMSLSGKKFSHQELLAIQAGVYKFSQELELTSKVVEKATSGVKQTMQTQV
jgi:hypothetical protein